MTLMTEKSGLGDKLTQLRFARPSLTLSGDPQVNRIDNEAAEIRVKIPREVLSRRQQERDDQPVIHCIKFGAFLLK